MSCHDDEKRSGGGNDSEVERTERMKSWNPRDHFSVDELINYVK